MIKITIRQLEIFQAIATRGGVTKAGAAIGLTQSAVSMALAELELSLGATVFDRKGKKLHLNQLGENLLKEADFLVEHAKKIEHLSRSAEDELVGDIKVGASTTIGNYVLPPYLLEFKHMHPRVNIELIITNTEKVLEGLLSWHLDIGFIEGLCAAPKVNKKVWLEDELVVFCSKKHPLVEKRKVVIKDLLAYPWVLRESGSGTLAVIDHFMAKMLELEQPWLRLGSSEAIKLAVKESQALSIVSKFVIADWLVQGMIHVLDVSELRCKRDFYQVSLQGRFENSVVRAFRAFVYQSRNIRL